MDFLTPVHHRLRSEIQEFAKTEVMPIADRIEDENVISLDLIRQMGACGWYGVSIPKSHGGQELGHLARTLCIEEMSRISGAVGGALQSAILGTAMFQFYGDEMQQQHWLPRFASGKSIASIAVTEGGSGSHILGMKTTARRDGNDYILNGHKYWIANSHIADVHGVTARTAEGSRGLSAFIVEADRPGFRVGKVNDNAGLRGFNIGELIFEDCRIPATNLLGVEGQGLEIAHRSITLYGKPNLTAVALGVHQAILDSTLSYAKDRQLYDAPITKMDSIREKISEIYTNIHACRLSAYYATHLLDRGKTADAEIMIAKLLNTESAYLSAKHALDIHGARGVSREYKIERYLRDALMTFPPAGTSDVHRKRIAEVALDQYYSPWAEIPKMGAA